MIIPAPIEHCLMCRSFNCIHVNSAKAQRYQEDFIRRDMMVAQHALIYGVQSNQTLPTPELNKKLLLLRRRK